VENIKKPLNKDNNLIRLLIIFVALFILFSLTKGSAFLKLNTFKTMGILFPEFGILSIAMALSLFVGGIDLSVVFVANLSSVILGKILKASITSQTPMDQAIPVIILSFVVAILIGVVCGAINGYLIAGVGIPPILATLGTQSLFLGISVVITGGTTLSKLPSQLSSILNSNIVGIPVSAVIFFVIAILIGFVISKTRLGYSLRMLGTNPKATVFSGLSNMKLTIYNFMIIGGLAAIAGIVMTGRLNSVKADNGSSYTMQAILIAVLGGIDPNGGKGNIQGVTLAIIIVQMISTWLSMFEGLSNFYRQIIWGGLLLFVLIFNYVNDHIEKKMAMKG